MPTNRWIPAPPPPSSFGRTMSSTPYHAPGAGAAANHNLANQRLPRARNAPTAAVAGIGSGSLVGMNDDTDPMPSLLPMLAATTAGGAQKLVNDTAELMVSIAVTFRAEMRDFSAEAKDLMAVPFQALVDHIFNCTKPPSPLPPNSGGNASRRHPDFPESRLDKDVIDRVLGLKVAEIKDELSVLHNLSVAEVSKHFGTRKQKLQNRLLNDLESRLPPEEEDRGGDRNNAVGIVVSPVVLQSTVSACDPMAMESVERSNDDDGADNDCSMEVVPADVMLEDGPMATTTTETMLRSSRAGVENHLQSPPKVSEAAGDRSTGVMEPEDPVVPTPFAVDDAEDAESAPASSQVVHHIAHDSSSNNGHRSNNFAVDTTVASIPFDEVAATTGMDIDNNADVDMDVEVVDANKLEPVAEVDSCRKRSRSPSASSSSTSLMSFVKVPPSSAFGKENSSSSNSSTSSAVERVQSTFNNMSVQHSPLRKFAKVNDSSKGGGSIVATSAIEARRELDLPTGKSMTDPGPTWLDKRKAELAQQSLSVPPKPSRSWKPSASTATPSTAAGPSSVATLSKLYADDKFPLASSYQPPAAGAATTQPRSGGGGPTAPAANNNPRNLVEKMRNKNKIFHPNVPAPSAGNSVRPLPVLEIHPYRSATVAASGMSDEEKRKAMNNKIRQKALENRAGAARSLYVAQPGAATGGHQQKPALPMARPSPVTKVPSALSNSYSSPAATKKWNSASAKKTLASAVKKLSPIKPPPQSPAYESYPMTDSEDEVSDEDEYNEGRARKPAKRYPAWTHPQALAAALQKQYSDPAMDPDLIFGDFSAQSCDLVAIFGDNNKDRYKRRGSSGNWTHDRLTDREKHEFSLQRHQPALTRPF